jgi:N-acetylmuramoyl-L-alanine amidase
MCVRCAQASMTRRTVIRRGLALAAGAGAMLGLGIAERLAPAVAATARASRAPGVNGLHIISRDEWGCPVGESSPYWIPVYAQPFHIITHHTVTDSGGPSGTIRTIWDYHANGLGWGDIGYNYLIDSAGNIYEGRAGGPGVVGAHTERFNFGSIGVALIGDYSSANPSSAMFFAIRTLFTALANTNGIDPELTFDENGATYPTIGGHRDFNFTDCPGAAMHALLPRMRDEVARGVRSDSAPGEGETVYVHAGAPVVVPLIVRNTGSTNWDARFGLSLVAGDLFGLPTSYRMPSVGPGGAITIPLFMPALKAGQIVNTDWQLTDASGSLVGQPFPFTVAALAPGTTLPATLPAPTLTSTPIPTATATPTQTAVPTHTATPAAGRTATPGRTATKVPKPKRH